MTTERIVEIKRTELPAPDITDPERKMIRIFYRAGELPPRFLFIEKKKWTKELEAKMIREDIDKRMTTPRETLTL